MAKISILLSSHKAGALCAAALIGTLALTAPAMAQMPSDTSEPGTFGAPIGAPNEDWAFSLGLGAAVVPDYEGSADYTGAPIPILRAQKGHQYGALFGSKISSNLLPHPNWRFGPIAQFIKKRNDVHNNKVDKMKTIDPALMLGVQFGYEYTMGSSILGANVTWAHDVTGSNDGWIAQPGINYRRQLSEQLRMNIATNLTYASDDYTETYFGVSNNDSARSGLKSYNADAGFKDVGANVTLTYNFNHNWAMGGVVGYKRMLSDAADSPVVDDVGEANQFLGGVFFTYSWQTGS